MVDTIVIGGGIVGAAVAFHLVHHGVSVRLICRHDQQRATDAGAGIMTPHTTRASDRWLHFAMEAFDHYQQLAQLLSDERSGELGFERCGALLIAEPDDDPQTWQIVRDDILARKESILPASRVAEVSPEQARELFPALGSLQGALFNPDAYRIDGRRVTAQLRRAAIARGLLVTHGSVERLVVKDRTVTGVEVDGEVLSAKWVVIAGGAWSHEFGEQLGLDIPVRPEKGQIIHLKLDGSPVTRHQETTIDTAGWPIVNSLKGHYIVPWPGGCIAIGSTHDQVGYDGRTTARGAHRILSRALSAAPGLGDATFDTIQAGLRPVSPDGLPILGRIPGLDGVLLATGHGSTGLQLGPYSGKLIADLIYHGDQSVDIQGLTIDRWLT